MSGDRDGCAILCYHGDGVANGLHVSLRYVDLQTVHFTNQSIVLVTFGNLN